MTSIKLWNQNKEKWINLIVKLYLRIFTRNEIRVNYIKGKFIKL